MLTKKAAAKPVKVEKGGVTTPKGFLADGIHAGLKYKRKDLGIIWSEVPSNCAAVYTQSHFQAAPIKVTQESLAEEGKAQAIVVNSAVANACTGNEGLIHAREMRKACAKQFHIPDHYVVIASTGVIGEQLPIDKIVDGMKRLMPTGSSTGSTSFSEAILTTDLVTKETCWQIEIDGKTVSIGGSAKGSGMIHPNMATMLGFVTTDATIEQEALDTALREVTNKTYNCITVDGETSTNDMVAVMANGMAGNAPLSPSHPQWGQFIDAFRLVNEELAKMIARDGEGATKLIEAHVEGAQSEQDAQVIAKKIVGSDLVKTAMFGTDANWGRIIGAIGHSDAAVNPETVDVKVGDIYMLKESQPVVFSEAEAKAYLQQEMIKIHVHLHNGTCEGRAWGCDLTYDYVKINASYRT